MLDTTILVYAKGRDHPLRGPCTALIEAISNGSLQATTTPEVIQEFVHVRSRRRTRTDAVALGKAFTDLLSPLLVVGEEALLDGLRLFRQHPSLGTFDAVLAATAIASRAEALLSADRTFSRVRALTHVVPGTRAFGHLVGQ